MMSVFKKDSRNAFDNERESEESVRNCEGMFGVRFPHIDTVDEIMRKTDENCSERLKTSLTKIPIGKKIFQKGGFYGKYLTAADGTHAMTVKEGHCRHCLKRTSEKSGKTTYFQSVAEAKPVTENGFGIPPAAERTENPEGTYDRQDCGLKASVRIAEKPKRDFFRLPTVICGDGLYPNRTFFQIRKENGREFIISFRDGNLPPVREEAGVLKELSEDSRRRTEVCTSSEKTVGTYTRINDIDYQGVMPDRSECAGESGCRTTGSVSAGSPRSDRSGVKETTAAGRMRCKTENGGFDIRKNHGYKLGHKYLRVSFRAAENYCQRMQIAHIINQLFESSSLFSPLLKGKMTVKHLRECMSGELRVMILNFKILKKLLKRRIQLRHV